MKLINKGYIAALLAIFFLSAAAHAADKIRIGFPDLAAPFVPLAVGEKKGFFQEQGIQGEFIRINPAIALQALVGGEIDYYTVLGPGVAGQTRGRLRAGCSHRANRPARNKVRAGIKG